MEETFSVRVFFLMYIENETLQIHENLKTFSTNRWWETENMLVEEVSVFAQGCKNKFKLQHSSVMGPGVWFKDKLMKKEKGTDSLFILMITKHWSCLKFNHGWYCVSLTSWICYLNHERCIVELYTEVFSFGRNCIHTTFNRPNEGHKFTTKWIHMRMHVDEETFKTCQLRAGPDLIQPSAEWWTSCFKLLLRQSAGLHDKANFLTSSK